MSLAAVIERSKKDREGWKYTNLAPLASQKFVRLSSKEARGIKSVPCRALWSKPANGIRSCL